MDNKILKNLLDYVTIVWNMQQCWSRLARLNSLCTSGIAKVASMPLGILKPWFLSLRGDILPACRRVNKSRDFGEGGYYKYIRFSIIGLSVHTNLPQHLFGLLLALNFDRWWNLIILLREDPWSCKFERYLKNERIANHARISAPGKEQNLAISALVE